LHGLRTEFDQVLRLIEIQQADVADLWRDGDIPEIAGRRLQLRRSCRIFRAEALTLNMEGLPSRRNRLSIMPLLSLP